MRDNSLTMENRSYSNSSFSSTPNPTKPATSGPRRAAVVPNLAKKSVPPQSNPRDGQQHGSQQRNFQSAQQNNQKNGLMRMLHTAVVSTHVAEKRDFSAELGELAESASCKVVLNAIHQLSCVQGISERQAAEEIVKTFRKLDEIWGDYVFREGLDRLRGSR